MTQIERISLTDDIIAELKKHKERTGIGETALLGGCRHEKPNGLTGSTVQNWFSGRVKTALKEYVEFVLKRWRELPDYEARVAVIAPKKYVSLTPDMREKLLYHRQRTGLSPAGFVKEVAYILPDRLNCQIIYKWLAGKAEKARREHLAFVLEQWPKLPDYTTDKPRVSHPRVKLTKKVIKELKNHKERTGISETALLSGFRREAPKSLSARIVQGWLHGKPKRVRKDYLTFVLKAWEDIPDKAKFDRSPTIRMVKKGEKLPPPMRRGCLPIKDEDSKQLLHYRDLTFLPGALFKLVDDIPDGLSSHMISGWLNGSQPNARPSDISFVLEACRKLKTHPQRPIVLKGVMIKRLLDYRDSTGYGAIGLLKGRDDMPEGFTPSIVGGWLNGRTKTARHDYFSYVVSCYKEAEAQIEKSPRLSVGHRQG